MIVSQNTVFKVALFLGLRSHSSAGEIRRTEIRLYTINNNALEMNSWAKHPLHRRPENRTTVEIITPGRTRNLRMNEPHLNTASTRVSSTSKNGTISRPPVSTYISLMSARALATAARLIRFAHSANLIAFGGKRMSQSTTAPSPAAQESRRRRYRFHDWKGRRSWLIYYRTRILSPV